MESEQAIENRLHSAVGDKEKEISKLITQQHEICEQCAIALQAIAEKEQEIVEAIDAQEAVQRVVVAAQQAADLTHDEAKKAEEDCSRACKIAKQAKEYKNRAFTSLMLEDYMKGGSGPRPGTGVTGLTLAKCEFSKLCQLITNPKGFGPNDMEGVRFLHDVKPNMCDKIIVKFVSMGDILYDTVAVKNLSSAEELDMHFQEYLRHNFLPPTNIKSKLELLKYLFYFASFYLQKHPPKVISFFDYLLYLVEQVTLLSVPELVDLDHKMRMDFYVHPEWNWSQHRPETRCMIDRVMTQVTVAALKGASSHPQQSTFGKSSFNKNQASFMATKSKSGGTITSGQVTKKGPQKQKVTKHMVKNEICVSWNSGKCAIPPPKKCWRCHVCLNLNCNGDHMVINCPKTKV